MFVFFFFNDTATTEIYTLSLHDALPILWETNCLDTFVDLIDDSIDARNGSSTNGLQPGMPPTPHPSALTGAAPAGNDWQNQRIEGIARLRGHTLWHQMQGHAEGLSRAKQSGVMQLFELFKKWSRKKTSPNVRLHLIGHSSGATVQTWLGARALRKGFDVGSINLIAPAVRIDLFDEQLGQAIAQREVPVLIAHLTDTAEREDPSCAPYGHSLLYLVSRAYEDGVDTPILGLERNLIPAVVTEPWGSRLTRLASPGGAFEPGSPLTVATTHGGLDDDAAVQDAVIQHIRQRAARR